MQLDSLLLRKVLLLKLELRREIEQAELLFLFRNDFIEKGEVIAEEEDACWIVHSGILAHVALKKNGGHGSYVFVAETQVGAGKAGVAGLDAGHAGLSLVVEHVPRENLLGQRHGTLFRFDRGQKHLLLHARDVEGKQSAVFDYLPRDLVLTSRKFVQRNFIFAANLVDQRKISRGQHAQILTILFVDTLDVFGNHQANARAHFSVRRLFTARAFAAPLAAYRADKSTLLDVTAGYGQNIPALQSEIRNLAQRLVEIKAIMRWSDFIGRDVVAQLGIPRRILRIPGQIFASKLALDELRVFGEKKNAPFEPHPLGPLFDFPFQ